MLKLQRFPWLHFKVQAIWHRLQAMESETVLAVEWVTPEGEIVRLGSLGSSGEWFCGDGPGPSLRGIIRGIYNAARGAGCLYKSSNEDLSLAGTFHISDGRSITPLCPKRDTTELNDPIFLFPIEWRRWMRRSARLVRMKLYSH